MACVMVLVLAAMEYGGIGRAPAQNLVRNPDFSAGAEPPEGWRVGEGDAARGSRLQPPARGVRIQGTGEDAAAWRTEALALKPGGLYRLRFRGVREANATGGTAVAGTGRVNRDFPLGTEAGEEAFAFLQPHDGGADFIRLGQWHVRGALRFEEARLYPVVAVHERDGAGRELGEAESLRDGVYRFEPELAWEGANAHRVAVTNRAGFNSNRWLFQPGAEVVYRLGAAGTKQISATLRVGINYHTGGTLVLEVMRPGAGLWVEAGRFDGRRLSGVVPVPASVFPAEAVLVRLRQGDAGAGFQVDTLAYEARLEGAVADFEGGTRFVEVDADGKPLDLGGAGRRPGLLHAADYGEGLYADDGLSVWWCDSMHKVGRERPAPAMPPAGSRGPGARLELARGESEAVQVVLKSPVDASLLGVSVSEFRDAGGRPAPGLAVQWNEVAYVRVTRPTDATCQRGWYPDPLPPLRTPLRLRAGENQPLWFTVRAGNQARAGQQVAVVELRVDQKTVRVPLRVEVFGFDLPRETHLRSALGLGNGEIDRYHRLSRREDRVAVFEKYLANFAEHRISPYSFYDHAPIDVRFVAEAGGAEKRARVDFTAFDAAAERWLGAGGFNTFQLPVLGMGGGTFHSRHLGRLEGFEEGTAEHARLFRDYLGQVERHLRERGWLSKAFTYWFDEPDPKDYEFVVAGMKRLKEAAPGIRRMLTEQPEPALMGNVDIWCGLTPEWTREEVQERRAAGEEVWWYICTGPKAPYVTEFIDHPGTELRLWPWQSWQYGVTGILVWATVYWTSPLVYPEPASQDPWKDPMSWVTGYGFPVGHRAPWGNGDGRFLYPPRRDPKDDSGEVPILEAPINSTRWENLRDGMEDYEYLWLLRQETEARARAQGAGDEALLAEARRLLVVPESVSRDLTHFALAPEPIREHRRAVARMIERLRREP